MTDDQRGQAAMSELDGVETDVAEPGWGSWSNLWQMPVIILSGVLIFAGVRFAMYREPENVLDDALDRATRMIELEQLEPARAELVESVEPELETATVGQQGRYHQLVGDLVAGLQAAQAAEDDRESSRLIAEHYTAAVDCGRILDAARIERWGHALIAVGDLDRARRRVESLEALVTSDETGDADRRHHRLLRALVEASIAAPNQPHEVQLELLADYRDTPELPVAHEAWIVARQSEIRIERGDVQQAIDHLLVDVRRIEQRDDGTTAVAYGELDMLLGRAYFEIARLDHAEFHLRRARDRMTGHEPALGEAIYWLGRIALTDGDHELALEHFEAVLADFVGTPSHIRARLGRAEVRSMLGDHAAAIEDYRIVVAAVRAGDAPGPSATTVAESLMQRHEAALTTRQIEQALQLVQLSEQAFAPDEVPPTLLLGIASSHRQIADDLIADATGPAGDRTRLDPAARYQANEHYQQAATYFLRHARVVQGLPDADEVWPRSLWRAAESFDLAGALDDAIQSYREFIGAQGDVPQRPEAMYRLAQCYEATGALTQAVENYQGVIEEHPRGTYATRSHVPLARCYAALDRRPEAIAQLESVLRGQHAIRPEAMDYRDALIELGRLHHAGREFLPAIEQLAEAADRYPDDPRRAEVLFYLADSYRGHAMQLTDRLTDATTTTGAERAELETIQRDHLQRAGALFDTVWEIGRRAQAAGDVRQGAMTRRAGLYRADCVFHLGEYEHAIERYDVVAREYSEHHSSMFALVQIVNCFHQLGEPSRADAAHQRALVRLKQLPADAFDDADALMDREAWQTWLQNAPPAPLRAASATAND